MKAQEMLLVKPWPGSGQGSRQSNCRSSSFPPFGQINPPVSTPALQQIPYCSLPLTPVNTSSGFPRSLAPNFHFLTLCFSLATHPADTPWEPTSQGGQGSGQGNCGAWPHPVLCQTNPQSHPQLFSKPSSVASHYPLPPNPGDLLTRLLWNTLLFSFLRTILHSPSLSPFLSLRSQYPETHFTLRLTAISAREGFPIINTQPHKRVNGNKGTKHRPPTKVRPDISTYNCNLPHPR